MIPSELKDLNLLMKIQEMCEEAQDWDGPVSFENIWQACSNELKELKRSIGERIINQHRDENGMD